MGDGGFRAMGFKWLLMVALICGLFFASPSRVCACGHDGFYAGLGYEQLFLYTPERRLGLTDERVSFGPGIGAHALIGYDFCGSRWGIQLPFEYARIKLNKSEWVNQFASSVEGVLHLKEWKNGLDVHLLGGVGWSYLSEGKIADRTACAGISVSFGPGISYYFSRTERISAAVNLDVPFRWIYYFGDHLSANGTSVIAFPIRLGVQVGF